MSPNELGFMIRIEEIAAFKSEKDLSRYRQLEQPLSIAYRFRRFS
jgi:hypothetical protein